MAANVLQSLDDVFGSSDGVIPPSVTRQAPSQPSVDAVVRGSEYGVESHPAIDAFIDREIGQRMSKTVSWKSLEPCFKWRRIVEYLDTHFDIKEGSEAAMEVRSLLRSGKLTGVEYNAHERRVLRINHDGM
jgi:hypothetical protein